MPTEWIEEVADLFKALSEPTRLRLLEEIRERECTVSELAALSATSLANVSKHLSYMKRVGLVTRRKSGSQVFYALGDREALGMVDAVRRRRRARAPAASAPRTGIDRAVSPTSSDVPSPAPPRPNRIHVRRDAGPAAVPTSDADVESRQPLLEGLDTT